VTITHTYKSKHKNPLLFFIFQLKLFLKKDSMDRFIQKTYIINVKCVYVHIPKVFCFFELEKKTKKQ
jgi:hypothetical protein